VASKIEDDPFQISVIHKNNAHKILGTMAERTISFNRYNKGLLVAAGRLNHDTIDGSIFVEFSARFRNLERLKFQNSQKTYYGDFCFINFIPEISTVVFGSVGPITEHDTFLDETDIKVPCAHKIRPRMRSHRRALLHTSRIM